VPPGRVDAGEPWTFEIAVPFLEQAGGLTKRAATDEVLRYLAWPSPAICYSLGERSWLAARDEAQRKARAALDRRTWHAQALARGPMGLDRLTAQLDQLAQVGTRRRTGRS
jgi:uncharacterized protein (DUF885 family)